MQKNGGQDWALHRPPRPRCRRRLLRLLPAVSPPWIQQQRRRGRRVLRVQVVMLVVGVGVMLLCQGSRHGEVRIGCCNISCSVHNSYVQLFGYQAAEASSEAVDVNGTHFFGSSASTSWEIARNTNHPSAGQFDIGDNTTHNTRTTIPSQHHLRNRNAHRSTLTNTLSLPVEEYHQYRDLSLESAQEMEPNDPRHMAVPQTFCRAYCLDNRFDTDPNNSVSQQRSSFGYPTSTFRVTSTTDGNLYCLRRLDSVRCVSHKIIQTVMHQWFSNTSSSSPQSENDASTGGGVGNGIGLEHPGIVRWYKCFLSQRAVFFVHHYHAGSMTLHERFFNHVQGQCGVPLPESLIWSCAVQLVSAIRAVHGKNLAVRALQLNHILCTPENIMPVSSFGMYGLPKLRLRINCVGIIDVLEFEARKGLDELQNADMRALGCILLSMTTGTEINIHDIYRNTTSQQQTQILMEYFQFVQTNYSREMYILIHSLLNPNVPPINIRSIAASMAMRAFDELDVAYDCIDERHGSLTGIYESGRALRLMLKLAFVNERPEFGIDANWSESGDCYILKLFRDFGECLKILAVMNLPAVQFCLWYCCGVTQSFIKPILQAGLSWTSVMSSHLSTNLMLLMKRKLFFRLGTGRMCWL